MKVLSGDDRMNCKRLFLKRAKLSELLIFFAKIIPFNYSGREERVLKKSMFRIEPRNVVHIIPFSICCPSGGDFIKKTLRGLIFSFLNHRRCCNVYKPNS